MPRTSFKCFVYCANAPPTPKKRNLSRGPGANRGKAIYSPFDFFLLFFVVTAMTIYVCDFDSHPFIKGYLEYFATSDFLHLGNGIRGGVYFCGLDYVNLDIIPLTEGASLSSTYSSPLLNFSPALLRLGCCRVGEEIQPGSFLRRDCVSVLAAFLF